MLFFAPISSGTAGRYLGKGKEAALSCSTHRLVDRFSPGPIIWIETGEMFAVEYTVALICERPSYAWLISQIDLDFGRPVAKNSSLGTPWEEKVRDSCCFGPYR